MHPSLLKIDHRPWELPQGNWKWRQSWEDVLFAHCPISKEKLSPFVPKSLTLQEYDGTCWVGIIPLRMEKVMIRYLPNLPGISSFLELNVRTYVEYQGKAGVYFFSLDASNLLAVLGGRFLFHLPYYFSKMNFKKEENNIFFDSKRIGEPAEFSINYKPNSEAFEANTGTLEYFFTERYCLYTKLHDGLYRANVHHPPWPLQKADATINKNSMLKHLKIDCENKLHLLFSEKVDAIIWDLEKVNLK